MFNGNLSGYAFGMAKDTHQFCKDGTLFNRMLPEFVKYVMLVNNLVVRQQTLNTPHEVIHSVFKKGEEMFFKLGI
jgi:hypothetical protein